MPAKIFGAECHVNFQYDEEAAVWIATSDDLTGLVLEDESPEALTKRVADAAPELIELNNLPRYKTIKFSIIRHGKGDHDIYYSPITNANFTVDSTIKSRHTANAIMKQSGINYRF